MKLRRRFSFRLLMAMLLVTAASAALSTYALYFISRRLVDFTSEQSAQTQLAQNHAADLFRAYFADRKDAFRANAQDLADARVTDMETLARTPGLLRARLVEGEQTVDEWEADPQALESSREAPPVLVATTLPDGRPALLELTFGIPLSMYQSFLALREAIDKQQQMARVYDAILPRFLRQYVEVVLVLLAVAPLLGWLFARGVTRKVARLSQAADRVGAGDLSVRVRLSGKDELSELGRTFDTMVEELSQARSRLEYLQKVSAWQEVARRLAHEIKNPLTPIQLAVQEVASKYTGDDKKYRRLLDTATEILREEITGIRRLVDNFSAFARLPKVEPSPVDLAELLREFVRLQPEWQGQVRVQDPPHPVRALCDKSLFRRVLTNLVENALQATQAAGRVPSITISAESRGGRALLRVDDNGPGIPPDLRERIFDPYVTFRPGGTGLGLSIVRKIVIDHGGDIRVGDSPGGGARLEIDLPESPQG